MQVEEFSLGSYGNSYTINVSTMLWWLFKSLWTVMGYKRQGQLITLNSSIQDPFYFWYISYFLSSISNCKRRNNFYNSLLLIGMWNKRISVHTLVLLFGDGIFSQILIWLKYQRTYKEDVFIQSSNIVDLIYKCSYLTKLNHSLGTYLG